MPPGNSPIITGYEKHTYPVGWRDPADGLGVRADGDAAGTWDLSINTPNGPIAASLVLKKDGEKLIGSIASPQGEVAVQGTQKDKAVSVNFSVQTPNGPIAIVLSGNQDGDALAGTMDFGQGQGEFSGKRRTGTPAAAATNGAAQTDKPADVNRRLGHPD